MAPRYAVQESPWNPGKFMVKDLHQSGKTVAVLSNQKMAEDVARRKQIRWSRTLGSERVEVIKFEAPLPMGYRNKREFYGLVRRGKLVGLAQGRWPSLKASSDETMAAMREVVEEAEVKAFFRLKQMLHVQVADAVESYRRKNTKTDP